MSDPVTAPDMVSVRETRLYRIVVESWPTPDGKPLNSQPQQFWADLEDAYHNPGGVNVLPKGFKDKWPPIEDHMHGMGRDWETGHEEEKLFPPAFNRRQYLVRPAAVAQMKRMQEWGVTARMERSEPVQWERAE